MKVSRAQVAANQARIVSAAARLFRERGYDGVGVAELMQEAGLTHGAFYGHFDDKEALMARASAAALEDAAGVWTRLTARRPRRPLAALARAYLTPAHREGRGEGCLLAALGPEVARQGRPVRRAFTAGLRALVDVVAGALPGSAAARRRQALTAWSTLVGALVLARAVDDPALSDELLAAARAALSG